MKIDGNDLEEGKVIQDKKGMPNRALEIWSHYMLYLLSIKSITLYSKSLLIKLKHIINGWTLDSIHMYLHGHMYLHMHACEHVQTWMYTHT